MKRLPSRFGRLFARPRIAPWSAALPDRTAPFVTLLPSILERWQRYQAAEVDRTVSSEDDMMAHSTPGGVSHYFQVGVSAIELITEAMVLARRAAFPRVLDFPCGGGRVTRHLVKFFPDSEISVSDVERAKQAAVVAQFGVRPVECPSDFSAPLPERYDLVFVGSLLSHLDERMTVRALDFFISGLAPDGILVLTTVGRYTATAASAGATKWHHPISRAIRSMNRSGFGYLELDRTRYGVSYGATFAAPSWFLRLIESRADATVLGYKERAWDGNMDALIVQKLQPAQPSPR
jgi:SAM-dependent methyltransferase